MKKHTGRVEAIPCYVESHNECCLHMTMYKYVCTYMYVQTTPLSVSVMQAASYTPACITLTDNVQRYRYRAPSSTSGSWAHAHASCPLSVPSYMQLHESTCCQRSGRKDCRHVWYACVCTVAILLHGCHHFKK